jgi:hypothetical protein
MKTVNDLKLRSKLPGKVLRIARDIEKREKTDEFGAERVDENTMRFVWWVIDPDDHMAKSIADIIEFDINPAHADAICKANDIIW